MKKSLLFFGLSLFTAVTALAADFSAENSDGVTIYYNYSGDGTAAIVTYSELGTPSYSGEVNIPESVNYEGIDYPVVGIGLKAFSNCSELTDVSLPGSLIVIDYEAFAECLSLTEISIPASVLYFGEGVFRSCMSLLSVRLYNDDPSNLSLSEDVFDGVPVVLCTLYVPDGCSELYRNYKDYKVWSEFGAIEEAAYDFFAANSEDVPVYYNFNADRTAVSVTFKASSYKPYSGELTIPAEVTYKRGTYPVTSIGEYAFYECSDLTAVTLPESVTAIDDAAFSYCSGLTKLVLPESLTTIGAGVFNYCKALADIVLPKSLTTIGDNAFSYCEALSEITIPQAVTSLGSYSFQYCKGLTAVKVENSDPDAIVMGYNVFYNSPVDKCTLYVPAGSKSAYENHDGQWGGWGAYVEYATVLPGDVNGDGKVNGGDITYIIYYMLSKAPADFNKDAADVNKDGKINGGDITYIIFMMLNKM